MEDSVFSRQQYSKKQFWEDRYAHKQIHFDWYLEYPDLKYTIEQLFLVPKSASILMVGCGNSVLTEQMYKEGFTRIVNIDISEVVIAQMKAEFAKKGIVEGVEWIVADATDMKAQFPDHSFDVILDKGTLDALICAQATVYNRLLAELRRVMKPEGQMIIITHGHPEGRRKVFETSLPFSQMDYQFVKLILNEKSILINLMRSNLKDKPLNGIFNNQAALKQAMLEYTLIRIRKRHVRPTKLTIFWTEMKNKKKKEAVAAVQTAETNTINSSIGQKTKQQPTQQISVASEQPQQPPAPPRPKYDPQKQTHCYVYKITNKPHFEISNAFQKFPDFDEKVGFQQLIQSMGIRFQKDESGSIVIKGSRDPAQPLVVRVQVKDELIALCVAIRYLQQNKYDMPWVKVCQQGDKQIAGLVFRFAQTLQIHAAVKAKFVLSLPHSTPNTSMLGISPLALSQLTKQLQEFQSMQWLLESKACGHMQPDLYELLISLAKYRKLVFEQVLRDCWQPEAYLKSVDSQTATITLYLPPVTDLKKAEHFLKQRYPTLQITQQVEGYILDQPRWLNQRLREINQSYNQLSVVDYIYTREHPTKQKYVSGDVVVEMPRQSAAQTLAHLLWCWE